MKLNHIICSIFLVVLFVSCEENKINTCGTESPLEDIVWLKELKTTFESDTSSTKRKIIEYEYKNKIVFLIDGCVACPDGMATVYDCEKNTICVFGGIAGVNTCPDFDKLATNKKIIWEN